MQQEQLTVENYLRARDKSKQFALEKVEEYKRWNERYQKWKMGTKRGIAEWKEKQWRKITGSL